MAADVKSALTTAAAISDQRHKIEKYKFLLSSIISTNNDLVKLDPEAHKEVAQYALMQIHPLVVSFEEQVSVIREGLAELYVNEEEWSKVAQMLSGIDLESGIRMLDDTYKLSKCEKITLLYLEDDDASLLCLNRKFLEAALGYYELFQLEKREFEGKQVDEDELQQMLTAAIPCTILAAAGPQRSRVLATLYKDERCSKLNIYPILQKVNLERILRKPKVDAFAEELKPHQKALLQGNSIVLDRAMIEYNLLIASKFYTIISFEELGALFSIGSQKAEKIATRMVLEDQMKGSIDQLEGVIHLGTYIEELQQRDQKIVNICQAPLNDVLDSMAKKGLPVAV
ncbi:hypothetical protein L7F22_043252 [Adiantum nelumboides]|nr:hypothetical protein [Adiantum nelumboides]